MINSRKVEDLHPKIQEKCQKHIAEYNKTPQFKANGVELIVTSTKRDQAYQSYLYSLGRTVRKNPDGSRQGIVTMTKLIGAHGFGLAYDVVPVAKGKAIYSPSDLPKGFPIPYSKLWERAGEIARKLGFKWGKDFKGLMDLTHFEDTEGLSYAELRAGKRPSWW